MDDLVKLNTGSKRSFSIPLSNGQICYGHYHNVKPDSEKPDIEPIGIFVHGFRSGCSGTKAAYFRQKANMTGRQWIDFDLLCHGRSDGVFRSFRIGYCLEALLKVIASVGNKPVVLVGSSMGGWLSLLASRYIAAQKEQLESEMNMAEIRGAVLIAPAFDFVEYYFTQKLNVDMVDWKRAGVMGFDDAYSNEPFLLDFGVLKDSGEHALMKETLNFDFPIGIFHGENDEVVPFSTSEHFVKMAHGSQVDLQMISGGDHALNEHLEYFWASIDEHFL